LEVVKGKRMSIETFKIKLPKKGRIDLVKAFNSFSKEFSAKYFPETGIQGMFVTVEGITYCVYSNGTFW